MAGGERVGVNDLWIEYDEEEASGTRGILATST